MSDGVDVECWPARATPSGEALRLFIGWFIVLFFVFFIIAGWNSDTPPRRTRAQIDALASMFEFALFIVLGPLTLYTLGFNVWLCAALLVFIGVGWTSASVWLIQNNYFIKH